MQCSSFLGIFLDILHLSPIKPIHGKMFNTIITFCTKAGVDNHNPVKISNINKPGATPQIFCKVCVKAEPKNWPIDQERFH